MRNGTYKNYSYEIEENKNSLACRFVLKSIQAQIELTGRSEEEVVKQFEEKIDTFEAFKTSVYLKPLDEDGENELRHKIEKNARELNRILSRKHYLSEKNCVLTIREINYGADLISKILTEKMFPYNLMRTECPNYNGGVYYILIDKNHVYSVNEKASISDEINESI